MKTKPITAPGMTWIVISTFFKKYLSVLTPQLVSDINQATLQGVKKAQISIETLSELDARLAERKAEQQRLDRCAKMNNRGGELEKKGKIRQAIKVYEANIEGECYAACHSFDRLMVIYRKAKDYENEIRIIERALTVLCPRYPDLYSKYQERLMKAQTLQAKNGK